VKKSASVVLLTVLATAFAGDVLYLFNRRFSGGDAYPPYSSLRGDPAGSKLIFESLSGLPGVSVTRSYLPFERVPDRDSTVLLLGMDPYSFAMSDDSDAHTLEEFAQRGNRLVLAMSEAVGREPPRPAPLEKRWGVRLGLDFDKEGHGNPYFAAAKNWDILEGSVARPLVVERAFGRGSVVLVADSRLFSNRSVAEAKQTALLTRVIGPHQRIVFDETHFGIVESGSVVALARRFRLHGLALGLAIVALLFIWKNASSFPPVSSRLGEKRVFDRTSVAGLVTLLQRHVAPDRLASACWQEWLKTHTRKIASTRRAQAENVLRNEANRPIEALREIQTIVRTKGAI